MARLNTWEQMQLNRLVADKWRRRALSRTLHSPLLKWRYGSTTADQLLIIPQELRTADPSFWSEIEIGQFGLAGCLAIIDDKSPFDVPPPSLGWAQSLHGFSWLRHLAAADDPEATQSARRLLLEWVTRTKAGTGVPWQPEVIGRRLISWITHAPLLLENSNPKTYDTIAQSLGHQIIHLSATWRNAPPGIARLTALIAVTLADLTVAGHQRRLDGAQRLLSAELDNQILADGGHISRSPAVLVDLLLDLLPLSQCFSASDRTQPEALTAAIGRALSMLRFLRMGDGLLARFNGTGAGSAAGLATVLAYDDMTTRKVTMTRAPQSGYARLSCGPSVILADVGCPPDLEYAAQAHAGALSFEMSVGTSLLFINGGAPGHADSEWRDAARATSAHNALRLAEKSSSKLVQHRLFDDLIGGMPLRYPTKSGGELLSADGNAVLKAYHDGYIHNFGLRHYRELSLSDNGNRLDGLDRLEGPAIAVRLRADLPFSIHFHIHPDVEIEQHRQSKGARLLMRDGTVWQFLAQGAELGIEDSIFFADIAGASRTRQIVLRGATFGDSEVRWSLTALPEKDEPAQNNSSQDQPVQIKPE